MGSNRRQTNTGSIHGSGKNLVKSSELLSEGRLEIETELNLGNHRTQLFPVLSGTNQKNSGSLLVSENIGPELMARDLLVGDCLDGGTPLSIQKNLAAEPVGNGLLANRGPLHELSDAASQFSLASSDVDGATKRSNVRFIHEARSFTNRFVNVNNPVCMTEHKRSCIVVPMLDAARKKALRNQKPKRSSVRRQFPGIDGKTLGQRITEAMQHHSATLGTEYKQAMLVRDVERMLGLGPEDRVQPTISAAMRTSNTCRYLPAMATIMGVNANWLANGVGKMVEK